MRTAKESVMERASSLVLSRQEFVEASVDLPMRCPHDVNADAIAQSRSVCRKVFTEGRRRSYKQVSEKYSL